MYLDTGASFVADFTDAGMASTYLQPIDRIVSGLETLLAHAANAGCDVALIELADGVFQKETAEILKTPSLRKIFDAFIVGRARMRSPRPEASTCLRNWGVHPFVVSGMVSTSPLGNG